MLRSLTRRRLHAPLARHSTRAMHQLKMSPEVEAALRDGKPIVALESTIISHGMPFPQNFEMATKVEAIVRENGACPATIAILDGEICVGLADSQLHTLASLGAKATKCSTRDIASVVASNGTGATTVSSTMRIAHAAGIDVFVTGGIGGVHRFCEETLDISTDLMELSRTPVAVICAGVKSILDIPKTLEFLETNAVPVVGYGTSEFPAFFTTTSGSKAHVRLDTPGAIAKLIATSKNLGLPNGFVVAVPNPAPADANVITHAIESGLAQAKENNITGNAVTPFLLKRINELTKGESLTSNIALVEHNAVIGAKIAVALKASATPLPSNAVDSDVVVVGGTVLDIISRPSDQFVHGTSNIGHTKQTWGGVGRNIAECLHRLNVTTLLVSNVGRDAAGASLLQQLQAIGMSTAGIATPAAHATATYCAMLNGAGNLEVAIADMSIAEAMDDFDVAEWTSPSTKAVVFDGNLSATTMAKVAAATVPLLWFEPTSVEKARRVVHAGALPRVHAISPNSDELAAMARALVDDEGHSQWTTVDAAFNVPKGQRHIPLVDGIVTDLLTVAKVMHSEKKKPVHVLVTMGKDGAVVATTDTVRQLPPGGVHYGSCLSPPLSIVYLPGTPKSVWNCTGAGDSFVGGTIYGMLKGHDVVQSAHMGMMAARKSLDSDLPIHPELTPHVLQG
ncbi:hypothetical protein SDRG_16721 [Saprolegnia diclina VS20]|uniref:Carbohydrate kinase PfkB domain-containing protein n=1 Tax=Saprolegnia diclina (strain VS20) TaxID=1156394 RepID=T0PJ38_SAPDV|nr:hypothetical protein SDRG_16721 [Saprolegnia diclina VS20]EQC25394.1 hypothetical protein SDRG_16721 [Saprolegnia diclina VS20]|eukprot:XP_008621161.1 hypothetical protein SDRG_16721 [Saprolegnia diclina VS20]